MFNLENKIIVEYFSTYGRKKFLGVSVNFWIITLIVVIPAKIFSWIRYGSWIGPLLEGVLWMIGTIIIFPAFDYFFRKCDDYKYEFETKVIDFFNQTKKENVYWSYDKRKANYFSILLTIMIWVVWVYLIPERNLLILVGTLGYMLIWLVAFSALHYVFSIGFFTIKQIERSEIDDFKINEIIVEIANLDKRMYSFIRLIKNLENIFYPYFRIMMRGLIVLLFLFFSLFLKLNYYFIGEIAYFYERTLAVYMIIIGALCVFFIFLFLVLKMSMKMREVMTIEIKQAKLELSHDPQALAFVKEIEDYIMGRKTMLLSTRDLVDIIATIILILATIILGLYNG